MSYSGSAALALGAQIAIVTSARKDEVVLASLPKQALLHVVEAPESTVFVNTYVGDKRRQVMPQRAKTLSLADVPPQWRSAPLVHLGPLDDEVDPDLARAFPSSLVAATPQGWMRAWDAEGVIHPKPWDRADELLPILDATVFSEEDIHLDKALESHYASLAKLLVVTRASKGCTVYRKGSNPVDLPAPIENVVDATGAGDVFTGVFLVMLKRTGDVIRAAEIATQLASISVTRVGIDGIPTAEEIARVLG